MPNGLIAKFNRERTRHGFVYAVRRTISYVTDPTKGRFSDDFDYFGAVTRTVELDTWNTRPLTDASRLKSVRSTLKINWVIPDMDIGSGGHRNIFRIARYLDERGHDQHFYVFGRSKFKTAAEFRDTVRTHFQPVKAEFSLLGADSSQAVSKLRACDALIATNWHTAYPVYQARNAKRKFYMVQDFEPWFYPMSSSYVFAENTYRMGLAGVTNGAWLAGLLQKKYGMSAAYFEQAFDPIKYFTDEQIGGAASVQRDPNLVIYYARPATPRRGWELALQALKQLKATRPQTKIVLYGYDLSGIHVPFAYESLGVLNEEQLGALFRRASVSLVCSLTNYSIFPHEMMACGCPVVDIKSETTEGVFEDGKTVLLAQPTPQGIADALAKLLDDKALAQKIREGGLVKTKQISWQSAADHVERALKQAF
ncbi:MAG: glycosyltransferase family 4 protein [Candidatus Andersenbacteria bacterium]